MGSMIAISVVAAGMIFSLAVALLIEELIFGAIFRLFFGQQGAAKVATVAASSGFELAKVKVASGR